MRLLFPTLPLITQRGGGRLEELMACHRSFWPIRNRRRTLAKQRARFPAARVCQWGVAAGNQKRNLSKVNLLSHDMLTSEPLSRSLVLILTNLSLFSQVAPHFIKCALKKCTVKWKMTSQGENISYNRGLVTCLLRPPCFCPVARIKVQ